MIYSRSPEQYDAKPYVGVDGQRYAVHEAPRGSRWEPRIPAITTGDISPVMDLSSGERIDLAVAKRLIRENPKRHRDFRWLPVGDITPRHNPVLSSIRIANVRPESRLNYYKGWLETLTDFSTERLIALSPGLTQAKVEDAKRVLQRLVNIYSEEGAGNHA